MNIESFPESAKDIKLNLSSVLREGPDLTESQIWQIALGCALSLGNTPVLEPIKAEAAEKLNAEEQNASHIANAIMSMNNVYYRTTHLIEDTSYAQMPAGLRMTAMANPGVPKADFELTSMAISAINGCGMCLNAHAATLTKEGVSKESIQHAIKIGAVIHAAAKVLASV